MEIVVDRIGHLLAQLQSPDFFERDRAVRELGTLSQDEAVAGLVMALEDSDRGIRELSAELLSEMNGEVAVQLLIRFLGHEDIGSRNLAAEVIVKIGENAVQPLTENITDPDHDIRKFIVDILGSIGSESAADALCEALFDENINVVCSAAEALGRIGSARAIPDLVAVFDNIPEARLNVVEALGKTCDKRALPKLIEMLQTEDSLLTCVAIEAIGNIKNLDSVEALRPFLQNDDEAIAEAALLALINIGNSNNVDLEFDLPPGRFERFLFDSLRHGNKSVTEFTLARLASGLGSDILESLLDTLPEIEESYQGHVMDLLHQGGPSVARSILARFKNVPAETQELYLEVLRTFIDDEILSTLVSLAESTAPEIKQRLAHIFGWSDYPPAHDCLRRLTRDEDGHVRGAALAAMGWHVSGAENLEILFSGLDDEFPDVREAAMGALIMLGSQQVVEHFTNDLYHTNIERQQLAVRALGTIGAAGVVKPLVQAVSHPEVELRRAAIEALGRIRKMQDTQPLVKALGDECSAVRKAAVTALVAIRGISAIDEIKYLLDDEDVWVRYHTINAIAEIGEPAQSELIIRFLDDPQDIVRIVTAKALGSIGGANALDKLELLRTDQNTDIAEAAEIAVASIRREMLT